MLQGHILSDKRARCKRLCEIVINPLTVDNTKTRLMCEAGCVCVLVSVPQVGFPCLRDPAISLPYLSTHQHWPVLPWHWVALKYPSSEQRGTYAPTDTHTHTIISHFMLDSGGGANSCSSNPPTYQSLPPALRMNPVHLVLTRHAWRNTFISF